MEFAMQANEESHSPWNAGRIIVAKPPLKPRHIWVLRTRLQIANRLRDLAMFNLAIDSKLRGCDLVTLKVGDVVGLEHVGSLRWTAGSRWRPITTSCSACL